MLATLDLCLFLRKACFAPVRTTVRSHPWRMFFRLGSEKNGFKEVNTFFDAFPCAHRWIFMFNTESAVVSVLS